jgi:hypothetical protein
MEGETRSGVVGRVSCAEHGEWWVLSGPANNSCLGSHYPLPYPPLSNTCDARTQAWMSPGNVSPGAGLKFMHADANASL